MEASPRPSGKMAGLTGVLEETRPSWRTHCQKVWTFDGSDGSKSGEVVEAAAERRALGWKNGLFGGSGRCVAVAVRGRDRKLGDEDKAIGVGVAIFEHFKVQ